MTVIPIDETEIEAARALRVEFARFWSTAEGEPREIYDRFTDATPVAPDVSTRQVADDPGPGCWSEPADIVPGRAILFIHGGAYGRGRAAAYRGLTSQVASRARAPVFALDYPLAPEATVGPALDLALATLERLRATFASVAVAGDSAGGGLALATVLEARRRAVPVSAVVVFSPWTDLSLSAQSTRDLAVADPLLDIARLRASAAAYLGAAPATDPRASPLFDNDLKLPPTLIHVGSDEVLLDDSRRFAEAASAAGSEVLIEEWQGMHHVFPLNTEQLASARRSLDHTATFLARHWAT